MQNKDTIVSHLAEIRQKRGISAASLAAMVGVTRQTIHSIEAGSFVPNTAIGLRMAQALGVGIENLFSLPSLQPRTENAIVLPKSEKLWPGQPVQLSRVDGKLIAASSPLTMFFTDSDGIVASQGAKKGTVTIRMHDPRENMDNRILLAGCDPAMGLVASYLRSTGLQVMLLHQNSSLSLASLKEGHAHIAGTHLREEVSGDSNTGVVNRLFPSKSASLISFALWQEGLITATGNPKKIRGIADLARKDVRFMNREAGSGSRFLTDQHLSRLKLPSSKVQGYGQTAPGHIAAASRVKSGEADCCVSTEATARMLGLHFIPLESVRYDLVVRKKHLNLPGIQKLLDAINHKAFRTRLESIGGYDTAVTGNRVQ